MPTAFFHRRKSPDIQHQQLGLALRLLQQADAKFVVDSISPSCLIDLQNKKQKEGNEALKSGCWIMSVNEKTCPVQIREQLHTASKLFVIFEHGIAVSSYWRFPVQIRAQLHTASVLTVIFENGIVVSSYWRYIRRNSMSAPRDLAQE